MAKTGKNGTLKAHCRVGHRKEAGKFSKKSKIKEIPGRMSFLNLRGSRDITARCRAYHRKGGSGLVELLLEIEKLKTKGLGIEPNANTVCEGLQGPWRPRERTPHQKKNREITSSQNKPSAIPVSDGPKRVNKFMTVPTRNGLPAVA